MKKFAAALLLLVLVCAVCLTGCGKNRDEVLAGFQEIAARETGEDADAGAAKLADLEAYLDENLKYVDSEDADYMVFDYMEEVYIINEGIIDYETVTEKYSKHLSDMMNALLVVEVRDEEQPLTDEASGGKLNFDWDEVVLRALDIEALAETYSEELQNSGYDYMKEHMLWHYKYYINLMLIGTTSNPLFEPQSGEFDKNAESHYIRAAQGNSDTATAWAINEYFTYLDSIGYSLDYNDADESKIYYDTCHYIVDEAGKRVFQ